MFKFNQPCIIGTCIARPSKNIKSPYVADVKLESENENEKTCTYMAHSPALGLGNLIKPGARLYLLKNNNVKSKTQYSIKAVYDDEHQTWVGSTPLDANRLFAWGYKNGIFKEYFPTGNLKSEVTFQESRFDFCINSEIYIEVKCVPLRKENYSYFPEGYRKSIKDTVSPRAIKHINELISCVKEKNLQSHLVFIVFRNDTDYFTPNSEDKLFCETLKNAVDSGVLVHIFAFECCKEGYTFSKILKLNIC